MYTRETGGANGLARCCAHAFTSAPGGASARPDYTYTVANLFMPAFRAAFSSYSSRIADGSRRRLPRHTSLPCTILAYRFGGNMTHQFDVIVEKDSTAYFVASVPVLRGCHTQAKSLDVLMERIRGAVELCLEVQGDVPESLDFVGVQRISVAA